MKLEDLAKVFGVHIEARYPDVSGNWMYSLDGEVKQGGCLAGVVGRGKTIEAARADYLREVAGKTIVFSATSPVYRKELIIPNDIE